MKKNVYYPNTVRTIWTLNDDYEWIDAKVESVQNSRGQISFALTIDINGENKIDRHFNNRHWAIDFAYWYIEWYVDGWNGL